MKRLVKVVFLFIVLVLPTNVFAVCTDTELAALKNDANDSVVTYDYLGNNEFSITVTDITLDFFVKEYPAYEYTSAFVYSPTGESTVEGYYGGNEVILNFYAAYDTACSYTILRTVKVTLPEANMYYDTEMCEGAEEFFLCKKFTDTSDYTYSEVEELIEQYKLENAGTTEDEVTDEEETLSLIDRVLDFLVNNMFYIAIGVAAVSIGGIIILLVKEKRRSLI